MNRVIIIINSDAKTSGKYPSAIAQTMVAALKGAIANDAPKATVEVLAASVLRAELDRSQLSNTRTIYCPLTIQLPEWFKHPAKDIYKACRDIEDMRQWVERHLGYQTIGQGAGDLWLPVMLTAKEPIYGEVIGEGFMPNSYAQPIELIDEIRNSACMLSHQLLKSLSAPPSVYLLQFRTAGKDVLFDRLWPFPAAPAIASIGKQQPDLFACYWQCLRGKQLPGLEIAPGSLTFR
jgi:hypothetical protein